MKNVVVCNNCNSENDFYRYKCTSCGSFLRTKVANLDLGATIWKVMENPGRAFQDIIHSEHKNYIVVLFFLSFIKLYLFRYTWLHITDKFSSDNSFFVEGAIFAGLFLSFIILVNLAVGFVYKKNGVNTRFIDLLATMLYSFTPLMLSVVSFSLVEYALFGGFWFTFNPSPFVIKTNSAWLLYGIEFLFVVWSLVLMIISFRVHTDSKIASYASGIIVMAFLICLVMFTPVFL